MKGFLGEKNPFDIILASEGLLELLVKSGEKAKLVILNGHFLFILYSCWNPRWVISVNIFILLDCYYKRGSSDALGRLLARTAYRSD